jgi:hypothetical protein
VEGDEDMPHQPKDSAEHAADGLSVNILMKCQEFRIPPIQDALVMGKEAPIGCEAMRRALTLLHIAPFDHIELKGEDEDDTVGDILVRRAVVSKIPCEKLIRFIMDRVKPLMAADEILHLQIDSEVLLKDRI